MLKCCTTLLSYLVTMGCKQLQFQWTFSCSCLVFSFLYIFASSLVQLVPKGKGEAIYTPFCDRTHPVKVPVHSSLQILIKIWQYSLKWYIFKEFFNNFSLQVEIKFILLHHFNNFL